MEDRMDGIIAASMSTLLSKRSIRLTALAAFRHSYFAVNGVAEFR